MTATTKPATLQGTVDRIRFANLEQGFAVLGMVHGRERFVAVGELAGAEPGEVLELHGAWGTSRYGAQFEVKTFQRLRPKTAEGIIRFLAGIHGVGHHTATRLVNHWGDETLDRIEEGPETVLEVPGIGPRRAADICRAVIERTARDEVLMALQALGIGNALASKIITWQGEEKALDVVQADPYALRALSGVGFLTTDAIAGRLGFQSHDPRRVTAGIIHALEEGAKDGHCCLPEDQLAAAASKLLRITKDRIFPRLGEMLREGDELRSSRQGVYLRGLWYAEAAVARRVRELLARPCRVVPMAENPDGLELSAEQRAAVELALRSKVFILTGGPGTGKTTITRTIVRSLDEAGFELHLASPTGRAAQRLSEATGFPASTIHRLLEYHPVDGFGRDEMRPLEGDVLIVDEASMLDVSLARHLLDAVSGDCRVIFVGDADQLPSVGPGRVLCDLIESGAVATARLTRIFRQAETSRIVRSAHLVQRGELPEGGTDPSRDDLFISVAQDPELAAEILVETVVDRIPRVMGFDPMADVQVLTPMKKGALGTQALNKKLRDRLNRHGRPILKGRFRIGDRVMQMRNNYNQWTMNGEVGLIVAEDPITKQIKINFNGVVKLYEPSELRQVELAYACTIHKSQGSEYPCVVIALHRYHYVLLQRDLFYTALTRAKKLAVLVGEESAIRRAVRTGGGNRRFTGLTERLQAAFNEGSMAA